MFHFILFFKDELNIFTTIFYKSIKIFILRKIYCWINTENSDNLIFSLRAVPVKIIWEEWNSTYWKEFFNLSPLKKVIKGLWDPLLTEKENIKLVFHPSQIILLEWPLNAVYDKICKCLVCACEINIIVLPTVLHVPTVIFTYHADLSSFYIKTETSSAEWVIGHLPLNK